MAVIRSLNSETGTASIGGKVIMPVFATATLINVERFLFIRNMGYGSDIVPFILPFNGVIKILSTLTGNSVHPDEPFYARVYINGVLIQGVTIPTYACIVNVNVPFNINDKLSISMDTIDNWTRTSIVRPVLEEV